MFMSKASNLSAYTGDSKSAAENFGMHSPTLYLNHPRVPFEYYVDITLDNTGVALDYYNRYFTSGEYEQIHPLIKTADMPSMKIDTASLNQYNRKRIIQNKVQFDPVTVVFHDVADGKTLAFWELYYNYYFRDGLEPGTNAPGIDSQSTSPTSSPIDTDGEKHNTNDVLANNLSNHNFGYNLLGASGKWPTHWNKPKNLIKTISIFQVHAGRYNKVTLVNPRIVSFKHDTLSYAITDKTLELAFTFEYEYAYYNTENSKLDTEQLTTFNSDYVEIAHPTFLVTAGTSFLDSSKNKSTQTLKTGNNLQSVLNSKLGKSLIGAIGFDAIPGNRILTSTSSLSGILNIRPLPIKALLQPAPLIKSFKHTTIDNLKTLGATTAKSVLQSGVSNAEDFVIGDIKNGITGQKAYVPTDLSSPVKGATPGFF